MLPWIAYAVAVALLVSGAGAAAERGLRSTGRPTRWAWVAAMLLSVGLPTAFLISPGPGGLPAPDVLPAGWGPAALAGSPATSSPPADTGPASSSFLSWFPWLWGVLSATLVAWLVWSKWRLRRICLASPTRSEIGGVVHRTERLGPGVVGVRRPRILVPDWVLGLDARRRELVLVHEREHARCRDPLLLHLGWAVLALVPWLLPLWWQFRRLRMAVEMDCDRRVVDRAGDVRTYGRLLVEVQRFATGRSAPLLTGGGSFLGRRIRRLVEDRQPGPRAALRGTLSAGVACMALVGAALLPPPGGGAPVAYTDWRAPVGQEVFDRLDGSHDRAPRIRNRGEVRAALGAHHPERLLRHGIGGTAEVAVHVTAEGRVTGGFVNYTSGYPALDRAALEVAGQIRYAPAREDGEPVSVWIVQPLRFRVE